MNVINSSGWLEYFADGTNAKHFAEAVETTDELVIPTIILYEVFKVTLRETNEHSVLQAVAALQKGTVVELTPTLAIAASRLSLQQALPLADAIILATTRMHGATLWTQDIHFKNMPGVHYFPQG